MPRAAPHATMAITEPSLMEHTVMYTGFAAGALIVLGVVITVLGFLLAGNILMVVIGLLAVFGGGLLGTLERRAAH
jgi:hypothetical protein